jgi:SM-20-related protein
MKERAMDQNIRFSHFEVDSTHRKVYVLDGVISADALQYVHDYLRSTPVSLTDSDRWDTRDFKHLKHDFYGLGEGYVPTCLQAVVESARDFMTLQGIAVGDLQRVYLNMNLFGDHQFAHTDGRGWTALLFGNAEWHEDWGGEILFYPGDHDDYAFAVSPKPGRMLIFDGRILHRGGVPSKLFHGPRMSVAIKFQRAEE